MNPNLRFALDMAVVILLLLAFYIGLNLIVVVAKVGIVQ